MHQGIGRDPNVILNDPVFQQGLQSQPRSPSVQAQLSRMLSDLTVLTSVLNGTLVSVRGMKPAAVPPVGDMVSKEPSSVQDQIGDMAVRIHEATSAARELQDIFNPHT